MSYARFGHGSDVYVYEGFNGWVIHVATSRHANPDPWPSNKGIHPTDTQGYIRRYHEQQAWYKAATVVQIGLPHDGESFTEAGPGAAAARLEALRSVGYEVPQYAIDALREESMEDGQ